MRIITEPTIHVVGRQTVEESGLKCFLDGNGFAWESDSAVPGEVLIETAGRLCYLSYNNPRPGGNKAYIGHLLESAHGSCLEHSIWNLIVDGVSRSFSHELIRHRAGASVSQLSQRYVDESVAEYVVPPLLRDEVDAAETKFREAWANPRFDADECDCLLNDQDDPLSPEERAGVQWIAAMSIATLSYRRLGDYLTAKVSKPVACWKCGGKGGFTYPAANGIGSHWQKCDGCDTDGKATLAKGTDARKMARQAARSVLPNATETKLFLTLNGRAVRNILEQRGSRYADPEIRVFANKLLEIMKGESPNLFSDYETEPLADGTDEITTEFRKV